MIYAAASASAAACKECAVGSVSSNVSFFQAAASVFAVLLLTGVANEIREMRVRNQPAGEAEIPGRYYFGVSFVLLTVVSGELVDLAVLLHPPAASWEQTLVVACLAISVIGVPVLVLYRPWEEDLSRFRRRTLGALGAAISVVASAVAVYLIGVAVSNPPTGQTYQVFGTCASGACGLNERSEASPDSKRLGQLSDGESVSIACQTIGTEMRDPSLGRTLVWDKLSDGAYVTDLYVDTKPVGSGIAPCQGSSANGSHSG